MDPQGNTTSGLGFDKRKIELSVYDILTSDVSLKEVIKECQVINNFYLAPSTMELAGAEVELISREKRETILKDKIAELKDDYDFIFIDCPPSLGFLTINALSAADSVLIPIQCEFYALEGVGQLINTVQLVKKSLNKNLDIEGVILTMYDGRTNLSNEVVSEVKKYFKDKVYDTTIPRNIRLAECPSFGLPIMLYDDKCKGAECYDNLAKEFLKRQKEWWSLNKKFGLGKGLSALIPEEEINDSNNTVMKIKMNLIKANENQPRKNFDEEKIEQLAESIKEHGVVQPIVLKKEGDTYTIVAGERRWRASKSAGLKEIPAVVMDLSDKQVLEISLIENIQREDLNPIEEAIAYKKLIDEFNLTQEELSKRIGKSRTAVTNCMRLLNLDRRVQDYLIDGVITEGHGRTLLAILDKDAQYILAQKIIDEGLNVRDTEKLIKSLGKEKKDKINRTKESIYYIDIKDKLESYFGTKVSLVNKKNKGKIEIEYYSEDDLQRILDILKVE